MALLFLVFICGCSSQKEISINISKQAPLQKRTIITVPENRETELKAYNKAQFHPTIVNTSFDNKLSQVSVVGEKIFLSINFDNNQNTNRNFTISLKNSNFKNFKSYRIIPLSNWYTEANKNRDTLEYIPDALFLLKKKSLNSYTFDLLSNEKAQLFLEIEGLDVGNQDVNILIKSKDDSKGQELLFPVIILENKTQSNRFNSIVFNNTNQQSGVKLVETWKDTGFTHLQVNYVPTVYFTTNGDPIGSVVPNTSNSTGFRNTAYPWVKKGGSILLFWESRYDIIAPLENGDYIKPFTRSWYKAYKFLIEEQYRLMQLYDSSIKKDQVVIYVVDEFKSANMKDKIFTVDQLAEFSKFLEKELPEFKTLVTYGYRSDERSVTLLTGIDIQVPHINLPRNAKLDEKKIKPTTVYKSLNKDKSKWMYSVEKGKLSSLERFRYLPMISVSNGYEGFSWYAFVDHTGSTWNAVDGNTLDYSLFYHRESSNLIYKYWSTRLGTTEYLSPSLRLKAIERGLMNAKILQSLIDKKEYLPLDKQDQLTLILKILSKFDIQGFNNIQFDQVMKEKCLDIEVDLRRLQSELN